MQTIGVLLLAAAATGDGFGYDHAGVGLKKWLRPHVVASSHTPPPGGPQYTAATMGGPGAGADAASGRRFVNTKSQVYFLDPDRMNISWQTGSAPTGERTYGGVPLVVPGRYNFNQGYIYRLKLSAIPGRPNVALYPTIEVAPTTPATDAYLAHNAIPVQFTAEDFDQVVDGGNFVTKVIYLPDPKYQEVAVSGVETLVSTRLEPGVDPIIEADKRGTILLIVRLGAIDLESNNAAVGGVPVGPVVGAPIEPAPVTAPGVAAPAGIVPPVTDLPPGSLPAGVTAPPAAEAVPVDPAPAPAPAAVPVPAAEIPAPAPGLAPQP
ncbi:hypothetical protein [Paludisphaera rhizosphaerae]|uniref:hypothetical protein n=1 Tax=Paludisphaera rhizosphaerae TaxID=2711216 RepID=UPI0013EAFF3D|nr:hypothetical protein [Paludisphaera rhizosphaerae]